MLRKIGDGVLAGVFAGVIFGVMMQMMSTSTPEGMRVPMMAMVAKVVGSSSLVVGWIYHLFNSAVIGGIFGWLLGRSSESYKQGISWGAAYGVVWWVLGGLVLMPLFLGMSTFAPLTMESMRPVAMGSLIGHLLYGLILGAGFVWLEHSHRSYSQLRSAGPVTR